MSRRRDLNTLCLIAVLLTIASYALGAVSYCYETCDYPGCGKQCKRPWGHSPLILHACPQHFQWREK